MSITGGANVPTTSGQPTASTQPAATIYDAAVRRGANWFFWITGLSALNTVLQISGSSLHFIMGLGITQLIDQIGAESGGRGTVMTVMLSLAAAGMFVVFGLFANRFMKWAFIVGMALYTLDGGLMAAAGDYLGVAFHGLALYYLYLGMRALNARNAALAAASPAKPLG